MLYFLNRILFKLIIIVVLIIEFPWTKKLRQTLKDAFHIEKFRPMQLSAMNATLKGHDVILIMPTGGGKSLCYQLPALISDGK